MTSDAAATLLEHRKHGAFELLLSTPLSVREIFRGMWWALVTKFAGPVLVVLLGQAWLATDLVTKALGFADSGERWLAVATLAGVTVMLFCDLWALGWTAMWLAMSATNPNRATGDTIARILVLPWLLIGLGSAVLGVLVLTGFVPPGRLGPWTFFWIWFGLGLATDAFFGFRSRALLYERFRICAEQQFLATTLGTWRRLFRSLGKAWGRARLPAGR